MMAKLADIAIAVMGISACVLGVAFSADSLLSTHPDPRLPLGQGLILIILGNLCLRSAMREKL